MMDMLTKSGAEFSECRRYRYRLWRTWDSAIAPMMVLLLNPSTADETQNDPTIERCERRARAMWFGGLLVGNIFALCSTEPAALYSSDDPIGRSNDRHIIDMARQAGMVLCGWGAHGSLHYRGRLVLRNLLAVPRMLDKLHVLALNQDGSPRHPLYVKYETKPVPWVNTNL